LTDADLPPLETLVDLEDLSLDKTSVSDEALSHLKGLHRLTHLSLRETRITDNAVPHLKRLRRLERLDLSETLVTADGVAELLAALSRCSIIHYNGSESAQWGLARIHQAAMAGDVATIRAELASGVPIDLRVKTKGIEGNWHVAWDGTTPLMWAATRGQTAAVRLLIAAAPL
jgi:ankyrin repeat protein